MDVRCRVVWCTASTTTCNTASFGSTVHPFSSTPPHLHWCIDIRVHPYASPQHTKVQKQSMHI